MAESKLVQLNFENNIYSVYSYNIFSMLSLGHILIPYRGLFSKGILFWDILKKPLSSKIRKFFVIVKKQHVITLQILIQVRGV